ncbi:MAG: TonB-dependent receptor [Bacteroidetes bacterium]|nr:TonB-dependent receptor [Bacteroidota bacterium]
MDYLNRFQGNFFALIFLLLSHTFVSGQTHIQGVIQGENQTPLTYANIALFEALDSSLVKGELSNESGHFLFEDINNGIYFIQVSMLGYKSFSSVKISVQNETPVNLGQINLFPQPVELDAVEIAAQKPVFEQQKDRIIVNVQNMISASGSSVLDILAKSPGIIVDKANNRISLQGKDGVVVVINGKQNRMPLEAAMQLLASLNGNDVRSIELITNPPASYDAEGTGGVINIVLKQKSDLGTNGSYSLMAGYGQAEKGGLSVNFNHRKGKLNVFGNYSGNRDHTIQTFTSYRTVIQDQGIVSSEGQSNRDAIVDLHNASLGVDYQLTNKTILGGLVTFYDRFWEMDAHNLGQKKKDGILNKTLKTHTQEVNNWRHTMGNLNLQHTISEGEVLSVNLDYLFYQNNNPTNYLNQYFNPDGEFLSSDLVNVEKHTPIHIAVAKTDYQKRFNDKFRLEAGLKASISNFTNAIQVEKEIEGNTETDPELTQTYHLKENIYAAYTSVDLKPDAHTHINLGLRYEHTISDLSTDTEAGIVARNYGNLFPTISASRQIGDVSQINLAYQRRITRPTYNDMAPFVIFLSPSTFFAGNANILPAISDGIKLDYRWKALVLSLSWTHEKNAIANFQATVNAEENKMYLASRNLDKRNTANMTISLPFKVNIWWEMQNSVSGNLTAISTDYQVGNVSFRFPSYRINTTQIFHLPAGVSAEISAFYQSASLFGIMNLAPTSSVNLGIQKKFPKMDAIISLSSTDLFFRNNMIWSLDVPELNFDMGGKFVMEPRSIRLTYTQNLGNQKLHSRRHRETGSEAERQRVNN